MTHMVFRDEPYARDGTARVLEVSEEGGVVLDRTVFYPQGGGQPGDTGRLAWDNGEADVTNTVRGEGNAIVLTLAQGGQRPAPGTEVRQKLDWGRRFAHMRVHTALHLLSVVVPLPVTGGSIGADKGRLDFDMAEAPEDRDALEAEINRLIGADLPVREDWISSADLRARPELVKTMSVKPPMGAGEVRLIRIGEPPEPLDLQPCGGTHVARTTEIGRVRLGKIEKKGARNRRISLHLA